MIKRKQLQWKYFVSDKIEKEEENAAWKLTKRIENAYKNREK